MGSQCKKHDTFSDANDVGLTNSLTGEELTFPGLSEHSYNVIAYYDKGGTPNPQLDEEIFPLKLTAEQKADLVTFLKEGLSSASYPAIKPPKLPE